MTSFVDRPRWAAEVQKPGWYLTLRDEYEALLRHARASPRQQARQIADSVYSFFEDAIESGRIALGASGPDWDAQRQPVDTAVIHHTNLPSGITWQRIDAIHLTRIYARYYANPAPADAAIRGTPIFSGHYRDRRQVFYGYHWLIRADGACERLLEDHETGWQAGDWDVNCRSVGLCLDGSFATEPPSEAMIGAVASLLRDSYEAVLPEGIFGHREINSATTCPGESFGAEWKATLLASLRR